MTKTKTDPIERQLTADRITNGDDAVPLRVIVKIDGVTALDLSPEEATELWQAVRYCVDFSDEYRD